MTPLEHVAALYAKYPQPRSFAEDLSAHLQNGYVFSTPGFFVMARAVAAEADSALIANPWHAFREEEVSAWFVYVFVGRMDTAAKLFPKPLSTIAFARRHGPLRFYDFVKFMKRVEVVASR